METLLSLTSRRAGEWFKEELRELGGLDHIVRTISECSRHLDTYISQWTDPLLDRLRKIDRCLRVLENVMSQNEENQNYLLRYEGGLLPATVITLFKVTLRVYFTIATHKQYFSLMAWMQLLLWLLCKKSCIFLQQVEGVH